MSQRIPTDRLLADLWRVRDELGRVPTAHEYDDLGDYSRSPLRRRFGGWNAALEAAELDVAKEYDIDSERLLHDLRVVADRVGETPSRRQYREYGEFCDSAHQDRFGSWGNAVHIAGLEVKGSGGARKKLDEGTIRQLAYTEWRNSGGELTATPPWIQEEGEGA